MRLRVLPPVANPGQGHLVRPVRILVRVGEDLLLVDVDVSAVWPAKEGFDPVSNPVLGALLELLAALALVFDDEAMPLAHT